MLSLHETAKEELGDVAADNLLKACVGCVLPQPSINRGDTRSVMHRRQNVECSDVEEGVDQLT